MPIFTTRIEHFPRCNDVIYIFMSYGHFVHVDVKSSLIQRVAWNVLNDINEIAYSVSECHFTRLFSKSVWCVSEKWIWPLVIIFVSFKESILTIFVIHQHQNSHKQSIPGTKARGFVSAADYGAHYVKDHYVAMARGGGEEGGGEGGGGEGGRGGGRGGEGGGGGGGEKKHMSC